MSLCASSISFLSDGSEHVINEESSGSIIITGKTVMIDGLEYIYKPADNEPVQALLDYDESGLRSVRVLLVEGEKQYFINRNAGGRQPDFQKILFTQGRGCSEPSEHLLLRYLVS